jgi:hypothetical protein
VTEELLTAEQLIIGVLQPPLATHFVRHVIGVLQDRQARYQPRRQRRPGGRSVKLAPNRCSRKLQSTLPASLLCRRLCHPQSEEALTWTNPVMTKLGLTEAKTSLKDAGGGVKATS